MASAANRTLVNSALTASATSEKQNLTQHARDFIAWIEASAVNGATTVAAKIQHSPDGLNWKDLASFTNLVGVAGTEAVQVTVNVFQYIRSVVTLSGGTQVATVKVQLWHREDKG